MLCSLLFIVLLCSFHIFFSRQLFLFQASLHSFFFFLSLSPAAFLVFFMSSLSCFLSSASLSSVFLSSRVSLHFFSILFMFCLSSVSYKLTVLPLFSLFYFICVFFSFHFISRTFPINCFSFCFLARLTSTFPVFFNQEHHFNFPALPCVNSVIIFPLYPFSFLLVYLSSCLQSSLHHTFIRILH